jgi:tetratricopeptide (TPR) repeat protein
MSLSHDHASGGSWVSREVEALISAWERGKQLTAEDVLSRHAEVDTESAIRLIYEETCLRRESGQQVITAEVVARFPRWKSELAALFECDRLIQPPRAIVDYPAVGEMLGPFWLQAELGRGRYGCTFLASEPGLADRSVVLKVILEEQDEHLALASLRHTHIVPLFSEHRFPERGLRGLCMPYLGGTSLLRILEDLAQVPLAERTGKHIVRAIDRLTRPLPWQSPVDGPFRRFFEQATYVEAMIGVAACLADALAYSHARGVVHMDMKPSNVLITMDGQPMLLDFHLAMRPVLAGKCEAVRLGGTPGWMSPEQEQAMAAIGSGVPITVPVDGRSDIFSLGLLLGEAIGAFPSRRCGNLPPKVRRPVGVSVALQDILKKCLAPSPVERYQAATLAEDLRRELDALPLLGVRNRNIRERYGKWQRRHPGALAWAIVAVSISLVVATGVVGSVTAYRLNLERVRLLLENAKSDRERGRFVDAIRALERGLDASPVFPTPEDLKNALREELFITQRGQLADELHHLAEQIRAHYGMGLPTRAESRILFSQCQAVWKRRGQLVADGTKLADDTKRTIRDDLLEIASILSDLHVPLAPVDDAVKARQDSLRFLDEAEVLCGPSIALDVRREQFVYDRPSVDTRGKSRVQRSAWEHYELGRYYVRIGLVPEAAAAFQRSLDVSPQEFWPNFYHGLCNFRLHVFESAIADFQACLAIEPGSAVAWFNRALAYEALGRAEDANRGYTRAIALAPHLIEAWLNRGILSYKVGRYVEAASDFEAGLKSEPNGELSGRLYLNLALAQLGLGDRRSARDNASRAVEHGCGEAVSLLEQLR